MRRKEFQVENATDIKEFLASMSFGFLGTSGSDYPHITPVNFVYFEDAVYFHGARAGQKMKDIAGSEKVSFAVAREFALIPSYFSDSEIACPATAFFKSVLIYGRAKIVESLDEKARVLTAFMEKLQPQGGYVPLDPADPKYKELKSVSVVKIEIESMTAKFKFGQNQKEEKWNAIAGQLEKRNEPGDAETVENMRKTCPFGEL